MADLNQRRRTTPSPTEPTARKLPTERVQFVLDWLAERAGLDRAPEVDTPEPAIDQAAAGRQEE